MALDAATAALKQWMDQMGAPKLHTLPVEAARHVLRGGLANSPKAADVFSVEAADIADGAFQVKVIRPAPSAKFVILYLHSGGWVVGDAEIAEPIGRELAAATEATVVVADYRKAPEHLFPVAVDDAWSALNWVNENLEHLARPEAPIVVVGESAGGNLAAVLALRSRDNDGAPKIALQVLICPVTDADFDTGSYLDPSNQVGLERDTMKWFWDHYLPDAAKRRVPEASPLKAESVAGLAPAVIVTAEHDVLRDEGEAYAARLREAGVPVSLKRFDGQIHGFFSIIKMLPGSAVAIEYVAAEIQRALQLGK